MENYEIKTTGTICYHCTRVYEVFTKSIQWLLRYSFPHILLWIDRVQTQKMAIFREKGKLQNFERMGTICHQFSQSMSSFNKINWTVSEIWLSKHKMVIFCEKWKFQISQKTGISRQYFNIIKICWIFFKIWLPTCDTWTHSLTHRCTDGRMDTTQIKISL